VSPGPEQRYSALAGRFASAARLLDAATLLAPENLADWLDHLSELFDSIDDRLARIEKRLDDAGIPVNDGIPDEDVPRYLALWTANPITAGDHMDPFKVIRQRLAAYSDAKDTSEGASS
jgi:hypothetical protein